MICSSSKNNKNMTTLVKVYSTKTNKDYINKAVFLLDQAGIPAYVTGVLMNEQILYDMEVYVQSHDHEKAELILDEVYNAPSKLPGEFVCLEVQGDAGELIGLNVFYGGVLQTTWHPDRPLFKNLNAPIQPVQS